MLSHWRHSVLGTMGPVDGSESTWTQPITGNAGSLIRCTRRVPSKNAQTHSDCCPACALRARAAVRAAMFF